MFPQNSSGEVMWQILGDGTSGNSLGLEDGERGAYVMALVVTRRDGSFGSALALGKGRVSTPASFLTHMAAVWHTRALHSAIFGNHFR